ncbi:hypothetical protein Lal_00021692 [Lupinus albus]|nr:hypothetical protein Lal_00021692 [Lupinus albus]
MVAQSTNSHQVTLALMRCFTITLIANAADLMSNPTCPMQLKYGPMWLRCGRVIVIGVTPQLQSDAVAKVTPTAILLPHHVM